MKSNKRKYSFIVSVVLAFVLLFASACGGEQKDEYELNYTELTVMTNEEPVRLEVKKNGETYTGAISWKVDNGIVLSAHQGYVKGLSAGQTVVRAELGESGGKVELACNITVKQSVTAELFDITAYGGAGDIDVTLPSGLYTSGASASVVSLRDQDGNTVEKLKKSGGRDYVENGFENRLAEGYYTLTYRIALGDVSKEFKRSLRVKPANRYENIFLLDPVDGSEKMYGMAANLEYLTFQQRNEENPGQYVTYTTEGNSGYTEENGIDQNLETFLQSLNASGYNGFLTEDIGGYDTVYRMYCKKNNSTHQPTPFFYLNLKDTASSIYRNLDAESMPESVPLVFWVRVWHRSDPSKAYSVLPLESQWSHLYKCMNDGEIELAGVFPTGTAGEWIKCVFDLKQLKVQVQDANNVALGFGNYGTEQQNFLQGEFIFELYSVEIEISDELPLTEGKADVKLYGEFSGLFDSYTFEIFDGEEKIAEGSSDNTLVSFAQGGQYRIVYTLKNGESVWEKKYERTVTVIGS